MQVVEPAVCEWCQRLPRAGEHFEHMLYRLFK